MLLKAGGRELVMLTKYDGASCLYVSAQDGHLEVVNALLEGGGRDLVMLTMDGGSSCLRISAANLRVRNRRASARDTRRRCHTSTQSPPTRRRPRRHTLHRGTSLYSSSRAQAVAAAVHGT